MVDKLTNFTHGLVAQNASLFHETNRVHQCQGITTHFNKRILAELLDTTPKFRVINFESQAKGQKNLGLLIGGCFVSGLLEPLCDIED